MTKASKKIVLALWFKKEPIIALLQEFLSRAGGGIGDYRQYHAQHLSTFRRYHRIYKILRHQSGLILALNG